MKIKLFLYSLFCFCSIFWGATECKVSLDVMRFVYAKTGNCYPPDKDFLHIIDDVKNKLQKECATPGFKAQKLIVPPGSQVCFMGDIHGSYGSLLNNLNRLKKDNFIGDDLEFLNKKLFMVFLGDYVDRGRSGIEVLHTLAWLKWQNWDRVILLRGNHEFIGLNSILGFEQEILGKYSGDCSAIQSSIYSFFDCLPIALYLGSGVDLDNDFSPFWILCCHGGFEDVDLRAFLKSNLKIENFNNFFESRKETGEACGYLWSDFSSESITDDGQVLFVPNFYRDNAGYLFDENSTVQICKNFRIKAVFRGHQHSFYGLKIGGSLPDWCHWIDFDNGRLKKEVEDNGYGFRIHNISYPVFTFSTAAQANLNMPYDCYGILTTATSYKDWRLRPYEYEHVSRSAMIKEEHGVKFWETVKKAFRFWSFCI
jgi:hypothetical protein